MDLKKHIAVVNEYAVKNVSFPDNRVSDYIAGRMEDNLIAFDNDKVILRRNELDKNAHDIQKLFDNGSPVSIMTISLDKDYLEDNGVFGFLSDNVDDQVRLCRAIKNGLKRMNHVGDDDLQYVGVIQGDTKSVYFRVVMVNMGDVKLSQEMAHDLRCGIDDYLG